ncbi:MAG: SprT family zinc-dependent metalloprotease [bacterium]
MEYIIKKNKRSKSIRISVKGNGEVVVTMPYRLPKYFAERFVESKKDWIAEKITEMKSRPPRPQKLLAHYSAKDFKEHKEQALRLVNERITHFNKWYQFDFAHVVIRNQKTRWGSCSGKKNLNFNYKIVFLPSELADYLIVHELCHLAQMNHGPKFWALVAEQIPDYKERRKQLCLY